MDKFSIGERVTKYCREHDIRLQLINNGNAVRWSAYPKPMMPELKILLEIEVDAVVAYLRWEADRTAPTTPIEEVLRVSV